MVETLILLAALLLGMSILALVALKTSFFLLKMSFWAILLPIQILAGVSAFALSVFVAVVAPAMILVGIVGLAVTLPLLVLFSIPFLLMGLGLCLTALFFG